MSFLTPPNMNRGYGSYSLVWEGEDTSCESFYTNLNLFVDFCVRAVDDYSLVNYPTKNYIMSTGVVVSTVRISSSTLYK